MATFQRAKTLAAAHDSARSYNRRDIVGKHVTIPSTTHPVTRNPCWVLPCGVFIENYGDAAHAARILDHEFMSRLREMARRVLK